MTEIKTEAERVNIIWRAGICGSHHDKQCSGCQWAREFNDRELDALRATQDELVEALEGLLDATERHVFGDERMAERSRARSLLTRIKSERDRA